ncbi:MAG: phospholipid carrier-dependent glycosyltransferase [Microbacterium sp.]
MSVVSERTPGAVLTRWTMLLAWVQRNALWLTPLALTVIAAIPRLVALGHPHELVFDETYYVKDAWTLMHLGYESKWPDDPNPDFLAGKTDTYLTDASYVVHPPLGKWIIAIGLAIFGADSGWGWRFSTAVIGTLLVPLLYFVAKKLSGSLLIGAIAGLFLALDSLAISLSRVSLLDGILAFFILLGFWFVILDWHDTKSRVRLDEPAVWGPVIWTRPYLMAAGVALGCATATKWSGMYVIAGVGVGLVVVDAVWRRKAGVKEWYFDALLRQGPVTFLLLVPVAGIVYLLSWSGWLLTTGGYDRLSSSNPLVALWNYHKSMYDFHVGLSSEHPYMSQAWQWPLLMRPTAMWVNAPEQGTTTCGWSDHCMAVITAIPNPVVWYAGWASAIFLIWVVWRTRIWRYAFPLAGLLVTYVPWLMYPERTTFFFYTIAILPFTILALAMAIQYLTRERSPVLLEDPTEDEIAYASAIARGETRAWRIVAAVFIVICVLMALFYIPLGTGIMEPYDLYRAHNWFPRWV